MRFYAVLRISSLPIPLVNLTDLCKKFGTRWHTCAKTCAKSTIFQICLYETKLNGNNLNYIYNFHKFQLFPIVSVLLSSIWVCCSYFPMQEMEIFEYQLVKYRSNEYWAEKNCASDRKWHNSLLHSTLHFSSLFISPKFIFSLFSFIFFAFCAFLTLWLYKSTTFQ